MTAIRITNFGGEIPRLQDRGLPPDAAQVNQNLLATSNDFRPLQTDMNVASAPVGAKTLYRLSRDAAGNPQSSDGAGWIAETADKNYVKGQINDDATERTYVSFNAGTALPRVIDAQGTDRILGVPAPTAKPVAVVNAGAQFTQEDADTFVASTLVPAMKSGLLATLPVNEPDVRQAGPFNYYGAVNATYPTSQRGFLEPWNLMVPVASNQEAALADPRLGGVRSGGTLYIPIMGRALFAAPDQFLFEDNLRQIENPVTGSQFFTEPKITALGNEVAGLFSITEGPIKQKRDELTDIVRQFTTLAAGGYSTALLTITNTYYTRTDTSVPLDNAQDNAASAIYDACMAFSTPQSFFDPSGGGA